jgi:hypothetical protein
MRSVIATCSASLALLSLAVAGCSSASTPSSPRISSRAYTGHQSVGDLNNFVTVYPAAVGTRLDDCQTCHTGGSFTTGTSDRLATVTKNACDFCHLIQHPGSGLNEMQPQSFAETLNPYGRDYRDAGRTEAALRAIAPRDSDGDGAANQSEIASLKYPGDETSRPGQPTAPMKTFSLAQLTALAAHAEFLLANANRQQFDFYATYRGVKFTDLLAAAGVDLTDPAIAGITVIAPDGFLKDLPVAKLLEAYPEGLYYAGLDTLSKGADCGFVTYPSSLPADLVDGAPIPGEPWAILAYERDGAPMDPSSLDITSGKINGEGPYRLVIPQANPGRPDRGSQYSPTACNDGYDFDTAADHNAGDMVRGVIGIRVNPLPTGYEDFDYHNGGWAYVESKTLIIYGFGVTE